MKSIRTETAATVLILHYSDGSGQPMAICGYGSDDEAQRMFEFIKASNPSMEITTTRIPIFFDEILSNGN